MGMTRPMFIVCGREIQKSIKNSVHKLLADIIRQHKLEGFYRILENEIRGINGTAFIFIGLKHNTTDTKSLEGADILWVEEAENVSNNTYEIIIPTIRKAGSEIWVTFNPKNPNDPTYVRMIKQADERFWVEKFSWRDNPFFPKELNDERLKLEKEDAEAYQHIYEGAFDTRRSGAVYAKQLQAARTDKRINAVPYDPSCEVFTAWDLGFGDATSIWWLQFVGRELRWLDYYENSGEQLSHYVQIVKAKSFNYMKDGHYLPHDGGHGNIRGESVSRQLDAMGLSNTVLARETDINPAIELLRQTIAFSVFDEKKCADGLHALENYAYEWDEERATFKSKPTHNWSSHAADAARYAAIAASQVKGSLIKPVTPKIYQNYKRNAWMG